MMRLAATCLLLFGGALAERRVQMEPDVTVFSAKHWQEQSRVASNEEMTLQLFLKHNPNQVASFEEELYARASPKSPLYGQWFSAEEVTERLAPPQSHLDLAVGFLQMKGASTKVNVHKDIITFTAPASVVEDIIGTELFHFTHSKFSKVDIIRVKAPYSLPAPIAAVTSVVGELIRFPSLRDSKLVSSELMNGEASSSWSQCGTKYQTFTNIAVLQERYGFPDVSSASTGAGIALAEFQGQYYDDGDLEAFSSQCDIDTITVDEVVTGGNNPTRCTVGLEPCIESLLDIEYAGAVAKSIPLSIYYFSSYSLLDWAATVNDDDDTAPVHSVSYGNDEVQQVSNDYMYSCNTEFMKLGSKGVSVFFASGDQGVWGRTGYDPTGVYHPDFPADSPYITAVGGTDFAVKSTIGDESTWEDGGGGFSNVFAQPSWQADAVNAFLESDDLPSSQYYNSSGRGYPDVAALAGTQNAYFISYKDGSFTGVGGTSAASPVVASIFAIVVNERLAAGKTTMGWLNPFIYENSGAFNDVTSGTNSGGYTGGFTATEGWDAATGFGTPNYDDLLTAALSA